MVINKRPHRTAVKRRPDRRPDPASAPPAGISSSGNDKTIRSTVHPSLASPATKVKRCSPREPSISHICPGVFIGNLATYSCPKILKEHNITAVLSITETSWPTWGWDAMRGIIPVSRHLHIVMANSARENLNQHLPDICEFITLHSPRPSRPIELPSGHPMLTVPLTVPWDSCPTKPYGGSVLVQCEKGTSQSAAAVMGWLIARHNMPFADAFETVKKLRPGVHLNCNFRKQLQAWEFMEKEICRDWWMGPTLNAPREVKQSFVRFLDRLPRNAVEEAIYKRVCGIKGRVEQIMSGMTAGDVAAGESADQGMHVPEFEKVQASEVMDWISTMNYDE